jgi:hypothetical protein
MGAQKSALQSSTEEQAVSQLERELAKAYLQGDAKGSINQRLNHRWQ